MLKSCSYFYIDNQNQYPDNFFRKQKIESKKYSLEHTDGLNYINTYFRRVDEVFALSQNGRIDVFEGLGVGILIARTNTTLLNKGATTSFTFLVMALTH